MTLVGSEKRLTDALKRPLHDLRISVIDTCNLRCTYCMPEEHFHERYRFLDSSERLSFDEIERLARLFVGLGVSKLRITGGEPLLRKDLPCLVERLARLEGVDDLAMTTNGLLLARHAAALKQAGLHRLTVSLDSLDDEVSARMNGRSHGTAPVLEGIAKSVEAGFGPIKINVVVQRGVNDESLLNLVAYAREHGHIIRFIEFMDVGNRNGWRREDVVPSRQILHAIGSRYPLEPLEPNYRGEVAERYAFADGAGEVGFISSITQPFCGDCSRARLSPDGKLFTCLFRGDGTDLRGPMRDGATDEQVRDMIGQVWRQRTDRYSELRGSLQPDDGAARKIEMYQIGG